MPSLTPLETALAIVAVLAVVGLIAYYFRSTAQFSGFEEIAADVRQIRRAIGGEIFRDGADLVISGNYGQLPAIVRFSYLENTPGLNIQVKAPATFALSCAPRGGDTPGAEGRLPIKINDLQFDSRFTTRTDFPTQARMFLGAGPRVVSALKKLCCSTKTYFSISPGSMELSELVIPSPYTGGHVLQHLESMKALARLLQEMPGAERVKVARITRERYALGRVAIAIGVLAAIAAVVAANRNLTAGAEPPGLEEHLPAGILPLDAPALGEVKGWRLATEDDLGSDVRGWLRAERRPFQGRIEGQFSAEGGPRDVAYVLRNEAGAWRVVLLAHGEKIYDVTWEELAGVTRFSRFSLPGMEWAGVPLEEVETDGLLLIRRPNDLASGLAIFPKENRIVSASPVNYQAVRLN
jgi:hypothetical protein